MTPYGGLPPQAYWKHALVDTAPGDYLPVSEVGTTIRHDTRVASAGSCFAQNIARWLRENGFTYLVTEPGPDGLAEEERRAAGWGIYPARFANIYTALQLLQLIERAYGRFSPCEDAWRSEGSSGPGWVDPFRPFIQPAAFATPAELAADREAHLAAVRRMFEEMDVFVFTLGLTEAWRSLEDGAVFPVCPGSRGCGRFDPARHAFVNFGVAEVVAHLEAFLDRLEEVNPRARVILTVSPVPLVATMEPRDVLQSTVHSKSVLRVAAGDIAARRPQVDYFASYEIITGTFQTDRYYAADRRNVTPEGVAHVMRAFSSLFVQGRDREGQDRKGTEADAVHAAPPSEPESLPEVICDEAMAYSRGYTDGLTDFPLPLCDFYRDGHITSYIAADHSINSTYRGILCTLAPGRHRVTESLEEWLEALVKAAAGRKIAVCFGASHTCMVPNWPYPMAQRLDRVAAGRWLVINAGAFAWTVVRIADFLPVLSRILADRGLRIDRALSLDGANDILYRLGLSYRHLVERHPTVSSVLLREEEGFLPRHGYPMQPLPPLPADLNIIESRLDAGEVYGRNPPSIYRPLPEWSVDIVERFLLSVDVTQRAADDLGIPLTSILQPIAYCPERSPQAGRVRRKFRQDSSDGGLDFFEWRRKNRMPLHAGEYLIIIPAEESRINVIFDLTAPVSAVTMAWERMAAARPGRFIDLNDLYHRAGSAVVDGFFQPDGYHYSHEGALWIGEQAAALFPDGQQGGRQA